MMLIFLVGIVGLILVRTLKKDYARLSKRDDDEDSTLDANEDVGWKQV
tara:strand:+ start:1335 stop:1478 length:144 start_codon:yes stop_codon:yes gene_type:complete